MNSLATFNMRQQTIDIWYLISNRAGSWIARRLNNTDNLIDSHLLDVVRY